MRTLGVFLLFLALASAPAAAQTAGESLDAELSDLRTADAANASQIGANAAAIIDLAERVAALEDGTDPGPDPGPDPGDIGVLSVCPDNRSICVDGERRFLLGDTVWWGNARMSFADWQSYLTTRKEQGFDFVMVVGAIWGKRGDPTMQPNLGGDLPIVGGDFRRTNAPYWSEFDRWVKEAARQGVYVGVFPVWGAAYFPENPSSTSTRLFTKTTARAYCAGVATALAGNDNIVWMLGGDHGTTKTVRLSDGLTTTFDYRPIIDLCAAGIEANTARSFIGYHTWADSATCYRLSGKPWLRFHSTQTGHPNKPIWLAGTVKGCWTSGAADRDPKPTVNLEPWYEGITLSRNMARWNPSGQVAGPHEIRREAYWSVIGWGTAMHAYGNSEVTQVCLPGVACRFHPGGGDWRIAIEAGGAEDMRYVKAFAEAIGQLAPAPELLISNVSEFDHIVAGKGEDLIAAYTYGGDAIRLRLGSLGGTLSGYWYDPRTGARTIISPFSNPGTKNFTPPDSEDWALVVSTN